MNMVALHPEFAQALLARGVPLSAVQQRKSEPRRWELREHGLLPAHTHAGELARRAKQRKWQEAKRLAAKKLAYRSRNAILREIRRAPHVYL